MTTSELHLTTIEIQLCNDNTSFLLQGLANFESQPLKLICFQGGEFHPSQFTTVAKEKSLCFTWA